MTLQHHMVVFLATSFLLTASETVWGQTRIRNPAGAAEAETFGLDDFRAPKEPKALLLPPSLAYEVDIDFIGQVALGPVDVAALLREDAERALIDKILRYGVGRDIVVELRDGQWYELPGLGHLWIVEVIAEGAMGIRLHFSDVDLPEGAQVFVYAASDPERLAGPYGSRGPFGDGQFWTPTRFDELLRVEYFVPVEAAEDFDTPAFVIDGLQHIYRNPIGGNGGKAGEGDQAEKGGDSPPQTNDALPQPFQTRPEREQVGPADTEALLSAAPTAADQVEDNLATNSADTRGKEIEAPVPPRVWQHGPRMKDAPRATAVRTSGSAAEDASANALLSDTASPPEDTKGLSSLRTMIDADPRRAQLHQARLHALREFHGPRAGTGDYADDGNGNASRYSDGKEDFEGSFPDCWWFVGDTDPDSGEDYWDDVSCFSHYGSWSGWCADIGDQPNCVNYDDDMWAYMYIECEYLGSYSQGTNRFYYDRWVDAESCCDYFTYEVYGWEQNPGHANWPPPDEYFPLEPGIYSTDGWQDRYFQMSSSWDTINYICIVFWFHSDYSIHNYQGAYLDEIELNNRPDTAIYPYCGGFPPPAQPDLTPYQPSHWNDKIPIGITQLGGADSHTYPLNGPYYNNQTLYFNWASANIGDATASDYCVRVEVTGAGGDTFEWCNITTNPGYCTYLTTDRAVGPLSTGQHTFKLWVDYYNDVPNESNEYNNYYERTITVEEAFQPPYLVESGCYVTPTEAEPGESITVYYRIYNPNSTAVTVGLGCSIVGCTTPETYNSPNCDRYESVPPGEHSYPRCFDIPADAVAQLYDVIWCIWEEIGVEPPWDCFERSCYLEVGCRIDVTCYPAWENLAKAAARIQYVSGGDSFVCTGQLLNDQLSDSTPYFLTANHCIDTQAEAQSAELYWLYQTSTCNGSPPPLSSVPQSAVCTLLSTGSASDYTLLMVEGELPSGLYWAGWTSASISNGTACTGIHHPAGTHKRISFGSKTSTTSTHHWIGWSEGGTEGGSSGSGIFKDSTEQLFGQLTGGPGIPDCYFEDNYGRFDVTYSDPNISGLLAGGSDDYLEENDTCSTSTSVGTDSYPNLIVKSVDEDWYEIAVAGGGTLDADVFFTDDFGDIDIQLYDACGGSIVASSTSITDNESISYDNPGGTTNFYLRVYLFSDTRNDYVLDIDCGVDTTPPSPDPMTFASPPAPVSPWEICMTATTAVDEHSPPVQYFFDFVSGGPGGNDSGWQPSTLYCDDGLVPNNIYTYRVRARDSASPPNVTAYSSNGSTSTLANVPGAPTLSDATVCTLDLDVNPNGNPSYTDFAIRCMASSPSDPSWNGQYVNGSGDPSGSATWQTDSQWGTITIQGLQDCTDYTFAVRARNLDLLKTVFGTGATLTTALLGDIDHDGDVDLSDLTQLLGNYGTTSGATYEDGDVHPACGDGDVDLNDLAELLGHYADICP